MNSKFFDLKKDKQDNILQAAYKVFALEGYSHASTDTIVAEASISKGLLFHYFGNKIGLYEFIYDYGVRFLQMELSTGVSFSETDLFEVEKQIFEAELQVMKIFPYILLFFMRCDEENVAEALLAMREKREALADTYDEIYRQTAEQEKIKKLIRFTKEGLLREQLLGNSFQPDFLLQDMTAYLELLKKCSEAV